MEVNEKFGKLASEGSIDKAKKALEGHGIIVHVTANGKEAMQKAFELIPQGAEVYDVTSTTLDQIGLSKEIQESGRYVSLRKKITAITDSEERRKARRFSIAPDYVIGSVHAVSEDGSAFIASQSGSQLAPYVFGASKVVWVVGTQKIVKNFEEAMKRLKEYALPLEDERARKAYGVGSGVNKLLVVNKEISPGRITLIFVKEKLGF